jgi:aminoglycoside phosphotransferase (APT) family kinase protein
MALEIERPGGRTKKMVVRRHGAGDRKQNPQIAADEFKLLQVLQAARLAAPRPYYLDQSGEIFSTPYIVLEYIEGTSEVALDHEADIVFQLATHLSRIHRVALANLDLTFLPDQEQRYTNLLRERPSATHEAFGEGRIRDTLESAWPVAQQNASVLLHGDFWPGNILWRDGMLVAVLDWEDAAVGDPLADLANSRLEMLWAFGAHAMQRFTDQYASMAAIDLANLPYWDLCAALRPVAHIAGWALDDTTEQAMREGHRWFIGQAFEKLSVQ